MKKTTKPAVKKTNPKPPALPEVPPLLVAPVHVGGVNLEGLPSEAWPSPSPVELATVAGACGWVNHADGAAKAMALLWQCAEVIHESRESAARFLDSIRLKNEWTVAELCKACGFDYQKLPDKITHADFLSRFKTERLKVNGRELRGRALFDHWHSLPEGGCIPLNEAEAWHARHKSGFECARFSFADRWEMLAVMVASFNEWRKQTARKNNPGKKNLKRGEKFPC